MSCEYVNMTFAPQSEKCHRNHTLYYNAWEWESALNIMLLFFFFWGGVFFFRGGGRGASCLLIESWTEYFVRKSCFPSHLKMHYPWIVSPLYPCCLWAMVSISWNRCLWNSHVKIRFMKHIHIQHMPSHNESAKMQNISRSSAVFN